MLAFTTVGVPDAAAAPASSTLGKELIARVNAVRAAHGLARLRPSRALSSAAVAHSDEMAGHGYFGHDSLSGAPFWRRVEAYYPPRPGRGWIVGENTIWNAPRLSASLAVLLWLRSPEHRANLLSPAWRELGVGAVATDAAAGPYRGMRVTIVTVDFGAR